MATASLEKPEGLLYEPDVISRREEEGLLERFGSLRFDPIVLHGQTARRTARHFGLAYDYEARTPQEAEPIPGWLLPIREARRARAAPPGRLARSPEHQEGRERRRSRGPC